MVDAGTRTFRSALLVALRAGTQELHADLEATMAAHDAFASLETYLAYLLRSAYFQAAMESKLEAFGVQTVLDDWPERRRAHLALDDRRVLGLPRPAAGSFASESGVRQVEAAWDREANARDGASPNDSAGAGTTATLPRVTASGTATAPIAKVLGILYVVEGSTLGGAVLLKSAATLGVTARHGATFLASYGERRGRMWNRFLRVLTAAETRGVDAIEATRAAAATFALAKRCLTDGLICHDVIY